MDFGMLWEEWEQQSAICEPLVESSLLRLTGTAAC
jgi:hypothetical protein